MQTNHATNAAERILGTPIVYTSSEPNQKHVKESLRRQQVMLDYAAGVVQTAIDSATAEAIKERNHWKANHDEMVARNHLLRAAAWQNTRQPSVIAQALASIDEADRLRKEAAELRAENEKLRKALEDVMKHQELLGGKLATHGTTWHIAEKALRK